MSSQRPRHGSVPPPMPATVPWVESYRPPWASKAWPSLPARTIDDADAPPKSIVRPKRKRKSASK